MPLQSSCEAGPNHRSSRSAAATPLSCPRRASPRLGSSCGPYARRRLCPSRGRRPHVESTCRAAVSAVRPDWLRYYPTRIRAGSGYFCWSALRSAQSQLWREALFSDLRWPANNGCLPGAMSSHLRSIPSRWQRRIAPRTACLVGHRLPRRQPRTHVRRARVGGWLEALTQSLALTRRHILPGAAAIPAEGPEQRGEGADVGPAMNLLTWTWS